MKAKNHWDIMKMYDPELLEKADAWRNHLFDDDTIPRKYKELMMVAMACTIRYVNGIKTHAKRAMEHGATKEELFATVAQAMTIGGVPAYREGSMALMELLAGDDATVQPGPQRG